MRPRRPSSPTDCRACCRSGRARRRAHKFSETVVARLAEALAAEPSLNSADLARLAQAEFGLRVHPAKRRASPGPTPKRPEGTDAMSSHDRADDLSAGYEALRAQVVRGRGRRFAPRPGAGSHPWPSGLDQGLGRSAAGSASGSCGRTGGDRRVRWRSRAAAHRNGARTRGQVGGRVMNAESHHKISATHLARQAYLYVRQSTLRQVMENTESTKRQYALRERAVALGWKSEQVVVIDSDLGQSGARCRPGRLPAPGGGGRHGRGRRGSRLGGQPAGA